MNRWAIINRPLRDEQAPMDQLVVIYNELKAMAILKAAGGNQIMIELKEEVVSKYRTDYTVLIDGQTIRGNVRTPKGWTRAFYANDAQDYEKIVRHRFSDIPLGLDYLSISIRADWCMTIGGIGISRRDGNYRVHFRFAFDTYWAEPFTFSSYKREFEENSKRLATNAQFASPEGGIIPTFFLSFAVPSPDFVINDEIEKHRETVLKIHLETRKTLLSQVSSDSLILLLDLPESVKVPCEQYLLYFVQFLKDVGVEANAELEHEAGQVLFSITPIDKLDGLDKVRRTLELYLQLPSNPIDENSGIDENGIAVQRLIANVRHLQGQLALARAVLQAKDATIQSLETTIALKEQLQGTIMITSMKDVTPGNEATRKEELLGGRIELGKFEGKGLGVNLGMIFRDLKKLFFRKSEDGSDDNL